MLKYSRKKGNAKVPPFMIRLLSFVPLGFLCFVPLTTAAAAAPEAVLAGSPAADNSRPMLLPVDTAPLIIAGGKNRADFAVEIARSDDEKARGLMYRRQFPQDRAMLFVFAPEERVVTMWMDNTPLPLDMIFADKQGKIVYIYERAEPFSHRLISSLHPVSYVAELRAGQVKAHAVKAGQKMLHPVICGKCA